MTLLLTTTMDDAILILHEGRRGPREGQASSGELLTKDTLSFE